jgi:hypothetical protein
MPVKREIQMRSSEEHFQTMLIEFDALNKQYEKGQIKYHQKTAKVDTIFDKYGWSRSDFFKELNARVGIQARLEPKKAVKTTKAKAPKSSLDGYPPLNDREKELLRHRETVLAIKEYRARFPDATLRNARTMCDMYIDTL